jgi:hypothetical protein
MGSIDDRPNRACPQEAPSGFEPLFGDSADSERSSTEQVADAVAELPAALRRIVQRVSSRTRDEADA